ncbi:MAG: undecaprenyl/decaprenyl-phosphate alpha-N-acetylglucosaminyl 1-phosphate transferase, partial [bacterium]|nr:undecaprenyl/decaprenyl-phosphate alpha-N-acetylglucosaminyl 1-phosphate transferase [bacterium]
MVNWLLILIYGFVVSCVISIGLTALVLHLAKRWNVVDHPGERKMQKQPVPLLGGVAIVATFFLMIGVHLIALGPAQRLGITWLESNVSDFLQSDVKYRLLGFATGALLIFILGLVDDLRALKPEYKLAGQIVAALVLVLSGIRLEFFIPEMFGNELIVTVLTSAATVFWIVLITNSFNLLDNMDGLSAGVSVIAALSFFLCLFPREEYFTCLLLTIFAGSVAGFLFHNFNPARIYMGDAGAMFCGYTLATVAVIGTFYSPDGSSRMAAAAPILALSVP